MFKRSSLLTLASLLAPLTVYSATATTSLNISATVSSACTISANNLNFGNYNPVLGQALNANTTLSVSCTNGTPYNVGLDAGTGSGATVTNRLMTRSGGSETLAYSLYQDNTLTTNWGNTVGTDTVAGTGSGTAQSLTVYGSIFSSNTSAPPGTYLDTVTVTITY